MSYILEALRKADRERNLGDVPDLEATHWGVRRTSRASHWPWVVAGLLLFNPVFSKGERVGLDGAAEFLSEYLLLQVVEFIMTANSSKKKYIFFINLSCINYLI